MLRIVLLAALIAAVLVLVFAPAAAADCPIPHQCCWTFGSTGSGPGQFHGPRGFRFVFGGTEDTYYVVDSGNGRVQVLRHDQPYDSTRYDRQIGRQGSGAGELNDPTDLVIVGSTLYVADTGNHRIQIFTLDGAYVGQSGHYGQGDGEFDSPRFITAIDDTLYVTDAGNHRVQKLTLSGVYAGQWGSEGTGPGQFLFPSGIAPANIDGVAVGDRERGIVQVFTRSGEFLRSEAAPEVEGLPKSWGDVWAPDSFFGDPHAYNAPCEGVASENPFDIEWGSAWWAVHTDPANDRLVFWWFASPVESTTWGSLKTRYRD
jgi:hypothetical protein